MKFDVLRKIVAGRHACLALKDKLYYFFLLKIFYVQ